MGRRDCAGAGAARAEAAGARSASLAINARARSGVARSSAGRAPSSAKGGTRPQPVMRYLLEDQAGVAPPPPSWRHDREVVYIMPRRQQGAPTDRIANRRLPAPSLRAPLRFPAKYPESPSMSSSRYLIYEGLYAMTGAVGGTDRNFLPDLREATANTARVSL